jgi:hypothetical protein
VQAWQNKAFQHKTGVIQPGQPIPQGHNLLQQAVNPALQIKIIVRIDASGRLPIADPRFRPGQHKALIFILFKLMNWD